MRRRRYEVTEMYALIDISNQMLEDSAFDMEGEIRGEATEQFAVKEGAEIRGTVRAGQSRAASRKLRALAQGIARDRAAAPSWLRAASPGRATGSFRIEWPFGRSRRRVTPEDAFTAVPGPPDDDLRHWSG